MKLLKTSEISCTSVLNFILVARVFESIVRWRIIFNNIFLDGLVIFLFPIIELLAIIYCAVKTNRKIIMPYGLVFILYHGYMILVHLVNGDFFIHGSSDFYSLLLCLSCLIFFDREEFLNRIYVFCLSLLYFSIIISLLSYIELAIKTNSIFVPSGIRFQGISDNPNMIGNAVTYGFIFGFGAFLLKPRKKLIWMLLIIDALLTLKVLIDSQCRAAMLFLLLSVILFSISFFVVWRRFLPKHISIAILLLICLIVILLIITCLLFITSNSFQSFILSTLRIPHEPNDSLKDIFSSVLSSLQDATGRSKLREGAISIWKEHPLFGVTTTYLKENMPIEVSVSRGVHNSFLQVLATLGLFGFIFFCGMIGCCLYFLVNIIVKSKSLQIKSVSLYLLSVLIAALINCTYENWIYISISPMCTMIYFLIVSGYQLKNIEANESKNSYKVNS